MLYGGMFETQYSKKELRADLKKKILNIEETLSLKTLFMMKQVEEKRYAFAVMMKDDYAKEINELAELRIFSGILSSSLEDLAEDFFYAAYFNPEVQIKQEILLSRILRSGFENSENGIDKFDEIITNTYILSDREVYNYGNFLKSMKNSIKRIKIK